MKNLRTLKYTLFVALLVFMAACYEDPGTEILFNGTEIEIQEATTSAGKTVNKAYLRTTDGISVRDSIRINLVGAHRSTPITVNFSIDEEATTAIEGTHYNMISETSVEIPANSSYGYIYYEVIDDNIEQGEVWLVKFNITAVTQGIISPNYGVFTRGLQVVCPFNRANFLGTYNTLEPGYGTYTNVATAHPTITNAINIDNFWDFGGVVRYEFSTNSASPTVTLPSQTVTMGGVAYTVSQNGSASYDPCNFSFVVPYIVVRISDNSTRDTNTHTFTKPN
jgi:hypothetical protein